MSITAAELMVRVGADTAPAKRDIQSFRSELDQTAADLGRQGAYLSATVSAPILAIGYDALSTAANFQQAMANVGAISGATGHDLELLTDAARNLGATTSFSASQAAEGMTFLAMAGFDVNETIAAMPGLLAAAAASQTDLGTTADIVSNILSGFSIEAARTEEVADILTATFTRANTDLTQLGYAMSYVAPQAAVMGVSIEETAAAIGLLSDAGVQGTRAGTGLNAVLLRLAAPTTSAADAMEKLGVNVFDAEGRLKSLPAVMREFERGLDGMTDQQRANALSDIFDSRALSAFNILLAAGSNNLQEFAGSMDSISAAEIAEKQLDTLEGQIALLNSALEGLKITIGGAVLPAFQELVSRVAPQISRVAEWFESLDGGAQMAIFAFLGVAAAAGPVMLALAGVAAGLSFLLTPMGAVVAASSLIAAAFAADLGGVQSVVSSTVEHLTTLWRGWTQIWEWGWHLPDGPLFDALPEWMRGFADVTGEAIATAASFTRYLSAMFQGDESAAQWLSHIPEDYREIAAAAGDAVASVREFARWWRLDDMSGEAWTARAAVLKNMFITELAGLEEMQGNIIRLAHETFGFFSLRAILVGEMVKGALEPVVATVETISGWMESAASGDLKPMQTALDDAVESVNNFDMAQFVATLSTAGQETRTAILDSFNEIDLPGLRDDILGKLGLDNFKLFAGDEEAGLGDLPREIGMLAIGIGALAETASEANSQLPGMNSDMSFAAIAFGAIGDAVGRLATLDWSSFQLLSSDNPLTRFFDRARATADTISEHLSGLASVAPAERFRRVVGALVATVDLVGETRFDVVSTATRYLSRMTAGILNFGTDLVNGLDADKVADSLGSVVTGLSDQFVLLLGDAELFDMGAAVGRLSSAFVNKLGEVLGSEGFGEDIGGAVGGAVVAFGEGAYALVSGIVAGVADTDWEQFNAALGTFTSGFIDGVARALEEAEYGALGTAIVDGISSWLANQWQGGLGAPVTEFEQSVGSPTWGDVGGWFQDRGQDAKRILGLPIQADEAIEGEWKPNLSPDFQLPDVPSPLHNYSPEEWHPPILVPRETYEPEAYYPDVPEPASGWSWPDIPVLPASWWTTPAWVGLVLAGALRAEDSAADVERRTGQFEMDAERLYRAMAQTNSRIDEFQRSQHRTPSSWGNGGFNDPGVSPDTGLPDDIEHEVPGFSSAMAASAGRTTVAFTGPVTIANGMDIEQVAGEVARILDRRRRR